MTSRLRTAGVSRLPRRSRSASTLATTPEELTQQTPPSSTAAVGPHPSTRPARNPGVKLTTASTTPGTAPVRSPWRSSSGLYSRPRVSSSSSTPISPARRMKSALTSRGATPPLPTASPANR